MKSRIFPWAVPVIAVLALAAGSGALAQGPNHTKFRGVINDYTPASTGGPWEVRGHWSLVVKERAETADFSAALTMERSDQGVIEHGGGDFNDPADRMAHTHHITLLKGKVTTIPGGFQVTGPGTVTANGMFPPPFGSDIPTLTITITGGAGESSITFSNITVAFGDPAAGHFGPNPLHGVVRSWE
jgi:hypothetical protein